MSVRDKPGFPAREFAGVGRDRRSLWVAMAIVFARSILGLIFLMAGAYKVFDLGPVGHVEKLFLPFSDTFLPVWSLWVAGYTIPFVELAAGILVFVGWMRSIAYTGLGVVMVVVTFGHLLENPFYPFHEHVIPRLALLLFVLMLAPEHDRFAWDEWRRRRIDSST